MRTRAGRARAPTVDELVLALTTLDVALDLRHRRLAHVHVRRALQVLRFDLAHRCSSVSLRTRAIAAANRRKIRSCAAGENDSHIPTDPLAALQGKGRAS